jgi:hypothetical protein
VPFAIIVAHRRRYCLHPLDVEEDYGALGEPFASCARDRFVGVPRALVGADQVGRTIGPVPQQIRL